MARTPGHEGTRARSSLQRRAWHARHRRPAPRLACLSLREAQHTFCRGAARASTAARSACTPALPSSLRLHAVLAPPQRRTARLRRRLGARRGRGHAGGRGGGVRLACHCFPLHIIRFMTLISLLSAVYFRRDGVARGARSITHQWYPPHTQQARLSGPIVSVRQKAMNDPPRLSQQQHTAQNQSPRTLIGPGLRWDASAEKPTGYAVCVCVCVCPSPLMLAHRPPRACSLSHRPCSAACHLNTY